MHIFDISDLEDPVLIGSVEISNRPGADALGCGSHTITGVPDLDAGTLVIYNQSAGFCATGEQEAFHVFEIPLDDPANPTTPTEIDLEEAMGCHDSGVILGDANLLACAAHMHTNVFDIGDNEFPGGSLTEPVLLYTVEEEGVCNEPGNPLCNGNWHSAAFTYDGEVLILGWEPGGGSLPECEATDPDVKKSWFFYDAKTGEKLGQFVLPRPQGSTENCTVHNYNVVPTDKRYLLVGGNYQAGISVVDFTDPANAVEVAYADPAPLVPTTARRRLVDLLVQRPHLRVRHHPRAPDLEPVGQVGGGSTQAPLPEPADLGVHARLALRRRLSEIGDRRGRPRPPSPRRG